MPVHLRCPEKDCDDRCESVEELATHLVADHAYDQHAATPAAKRVALAQGGGDTEDPTVAKPTKKKPRACSKCGKPGHRAPECTSPPGIVGQARKAPPQRIAATNGHDARGLALEKVREELIDARAMVAALERLESRLATP